MIALLLLAAAPAAPELTICPDRPSKANGVCTVPVGHWQLEVSAADWAHSSGTDVTSVGQSLAKLGITDTSDVEVGWTPYISVHQPGSDTSAVGDAVVRYKQRLTGSNAPLQAAVIPFVKVPTASHSIGNGELEGGLAVPLSTAVGKALTVTLGLEVDVLSNADGRGYHAAITNLVNFGWNHAPRLTLSAEIWNNQNFDPSGTVRQWSADASAAYVASNRYQLDVGVNLGLTRATPDFEVYSGLSVLF